MAELEEATGLLRRARDVCVLTGAGISTASGIPDFRGPEGVWTKDPEAEVLSSYDAWVRDPEVRRAAWARRVATRGSRPLPNPGHRALVELEATGRLEVLITQNVDGLHLEAGTSPARLVEIHGTSRRSVCLRCGDRRPIDEVLDRVARGDGDPTCEGSLEGTTCAGILKSATISFGQPLVVGDLERAEDAARRCDLLVAIGSTLSVWPVAGVVPLARSAGASIVIVNRGPTAMDALADVVLDGAIESVLPQLVGGIGVRAGGSR